MTDTGAFSNPRLEAGSAMLLCGANGSVSPGSLAQLRRRLLEEVQSVSSVLYGVRMAAAQVEEERYLYGVEVQDLPEDRAELTVLRLEPRTYCVVVHTGPLATLAKTWEAVLAYGAPPGFQADDAPGFERFGEHFDAESGCGEVEIWFPVRPF